MNREQPSPCIVVGYDGSDAARAAVAYAATRAGPNGKVYVVHCFEPPPDWIGAPGYQRQLDEHEGRGRALLDELLQDGDTVMDADIELELLGDRPAEGVARVAETRDADEIVVGAHGFGRFRSLLGSVSHELLHHASRPVTVIPDRAVPGHDGHD